MLLVTPHTLSEAQCRELERFISRTRDLTLYRRAKVILYRNAGYCADEIQDHTEYSERAQHYWVRRYREEGLAGLEERSRSGRPPQEVKQAPPQEAKQAPPQELEQEAPEEPEQGPTLETPQESSPEETVAYWVRVTLEQMYRSHPKRYLRERAQMVLLRDKGYAVSRIADILGVQSRTVRQVLAAYDRQKLMGLYRQPGSGRISRLGAEQWQQFKDWVSKGPKGVGYRFVKWTTRSLRWYIEKRFNVTFSREWIRQQLHRFMGQSWTRGKPVSAFRKDPAWQAERHRFCVRLLELLEQAHKGELLLLFEDESIFTLFGEVGYSWSPVGTTQEVRSAGKRGRVVVFGAADPQSGQTHYRIEEENINQDSTLRFVTQLVRYYQRQSPGMPLVIVLDKHPGHTSQLVEDVVKEHEHVTLVNTPTQSPDLNPIEHVWDWLGEQMIKNEFFKTIEALKQAIRHFFCYIAGIQEQVLSWLGDLQTLYTVEAKIVAGI